MMLTSFLAALVTLEAQASEGAPRVTFFSDVDVFDGQDRLPHQDVWVEGDRIFAVQPTGVLHPPDDADKVACQDCTLLPGLVDSHIHLNLEGRAPWVLSLPSLSDVADRYVEAGVTTVLAARSGLAEERLAHRISRGEASGPHIYLSGPSLAAPKGHPIPLLEAVLPWPTDFLASMIQPVASTPEQATKAAANAIKRFDLDFYKIYHDDFPEGSPHLTHDAMAAAITEARRHGIRAIVHAGSASDAMEAVQAGASLLMHSPYQDRLDDEQIAALASSGVPYVPTLRAFSGNDESSKGVFNELERRRVSAETLDAFIHPPASAVESPIAEWTSHFTGYAENERENTRRLLAAGCPWFAGTDSGVSGLFPGVALHVELERMVDLGVAPIEVLRSTTSRPAAFLDPTHGFGRVAAGQRADLLLVEGDPTLDIQAVDDIVGVWIEGERKNCWRDE